MRPAKPFTREALTALFSAPMAEFVARVAALPRRSVRWLVEKLDIAECRCVPKCRPPLWQRDDSLREPGKHYGPFVPSDPDYKPCPFATGSPHHGLDNDRFTILLERAYGADWTGPRRTPPPAPAVITEAGKLAVLTARLDAGYDLDRSDDPWRNQKIHENVAIVANVMKGSDHLAYSSLAKRQLLEQVEEELAEAAIDYLDELEQDVAADRAARKAAKIVERAKTIRARKAKQP